MMNSGDIVFYPLQGAGIVKALETHEFAGERKKYYKVSLPLNRLTILVPKDKANEMRIRPLATPDTLDRSRARFFEKNQKLPADPSERRILLQTKIGSGEMVDEMEVIRDLVCAEKDTIRSSPYDRYILQTACRMLISEMMYIEDISYDFAKQLVQEDIEIRIRGDEKYFYKYN